MGQIMAKQMFSPRLLQEIRDRFLYVDWDPYTGERVYLEASGGSLRLKSVAETMAKEVSLPDELYRYNHDFHIRVSARVKDSYSTCPLEGLGWPDAIRLSAAHYNTPEEIDRFLKATKVLENKN